MDDLDGFTDCDSGYCGLCSYTKEELRRDSAQHPGVYEATQEGEVRIGRLPGAFGIASTRFNMTHYEPPNELETIARDVEGRIIHGYKVLEFICGQPFNWQGCGSLWGPMYLAPDITDFGSIDYVCDILEFDINKLPWKPDVELRASPPCTGFSVAAIGQTLEFESSGPRVVLITIPQTETARLGIAILNKTLDIIRRSYSRSCGSLRIPGG